MTKPDASRSVHLADGITVVSLETPTLGDRSYLVHDGSVAFVVDPQRDLDRLTPLVEEAGVRITHVLETHLHNDYVSGGLALARAAGAAYVVDGGGRLRFEHDSIQDGEVLRIGRLLVTALLTPGHTFEHLSFVLSAASTQEPLAVFTGGSLLYGATGRPDLLGEQHTERLARLQHGSVRRLADLLPDDVQVFPTHGFGSFCSSGQPDATESTLAEERRGNPALTQEEDEFVEELVAGLGAYPAYYAHMAERNAEGPTEPDLSPPAPTDAVEVRRRIERGEWVVDLRTRTVYATGHVPGSLNFGLDGSFATYVGWLVRWGTPLTLLGESPEDVARAQRELTRIGIDRPAGARTGRPEDWADVPLHSFPTATFTDLAAVRHHRRVTVLDVRREEEHVAEHVTGAVNIPVHEVPSRLEDVPAGEVWVHCASGYRASIAASFLDAAGRDPVTVDDSFENASRAGLPMVSAET